MAVEDGHDHQLYALAPAEAVRASSSSTEPELTGFPADALLKSSRTRHAPSCCWPAPPPGASFPTMHSRCRRIAADPHWRTSTWPNWSSVLFPRLDADERGFSELAEGSPGRALMLTEDRPESAMLGGRLLSDLPGVPTSHRYKIADFLGRSETRFSTSSTLFARRGRRCQEIRSGRGDPNQERLSHCIHFMRRRAVTGLTRLQTRPNASLWTNVERSLPKSDAHSLCLRRHQQEDP